MRKYFAFFIPFVWLIFTFSTGFGAQEPSDAGKCMTCHKEKTHGLYQQWLESAHGEHNVTCISCHGAKKSDADAFMHEEALIATLVTPKDCGQCHEKEAEEVANSYHATAGEILESKDAYLAQVIGGHPVAITGCESCHGTKIEVDPDSPNMLSKEDWPNSGIGRINPDGSKGSCNACHMRHSFSKAQARQPEACSKCHLGPDHPQKEIYEASKHGNTYFTNVDKMNLDSDRWIVGEDYNVAPTCATCHISATKSQEVTHDVGQRISWTLRPEVSYAGIHWHIAEKNTVKYTSVDDERETMIEVRAEQPDGSFRTYRNTRLASGDYSAEDTEHYRVMDCVDCHNRATHIYEQPERAVDSRMRVDKIPRELPFIKREALAALTNNYNTVEAAMTGIANHLQGFYRRNHPEVLRSKPAEIDTVITVLQETWKRNIHPEMNITWGSYPSHIGHERDDAGCFRCHNSYMKTETGETIDNDCTLCHSVLANESPEPFQYLNTITDKEPEAALKRYLQREFLDYFVE
ncbi:MAG: Hydroxylamine oxidoreductase [Candidatus Marinimicrobia bacterium]|nr:Hydroxylamine oxidoreductase [Candidatus Neomarinimicrobiota bacterium]